MFTFQNAQVPVADTSGNDCIESSYDVSDPRSISTDSEPSFEIIEGATKRGKPKLFDRRGYAYHVTKNYSPGHRKYIKYFCKSICGCVFLKI